MPRILVIEDNPDLALGLANNLEIEGYEVDVVHDGAEGLARARGSDPALLILDLALPGLDGYRVLSSLRAEGNDVPVLILTARSDEADKVRGFGDGADHYVTKRSGRPGRLGRVTAPVLGPGPVPRPAAHPVCPGSRDRSRPAAGPP